MALQTCGLGTQCSEMEGKQNYKPQLKVYGTGTASWVRGSDVCPTGFITGIFKKIEGIVIKLLDVRMQKTPAFPVVPTPVEDWLTPVKAYLAATNRPKWRAYTDGSWTPPALSSMTIFATTYPGYVAGAGIVLSPDTEDWETAPYCCIEIIDGASLGCQNAYMMEVLAAAVAA